MPLLTQKLSDIYNNADQNAERHLTDGMGTGEMQCFQVADGVQISYDILNCNTCFRPMKFKTDFLQINYCIEGCYEFEMMDGSVSLMSEGDLSISILRKGEQMFAGSRIPLKKYKGITVLLETDAAQRFLDRDFGEAKINLEQIGNTLCPQGRSLLIKSKHEIDRIFIGLLSVDKRIRLPFFRVKTIELLLYLSLLDGSCVKPPRPFSYDVSKSTQQAYQYLIENPLSGVTITELSKMFYVAQSSLKRCFRVVAGCSIGTFMKTKRMEAAAELLVSKPELSISEVANAAGYENQSKFSVAFKSVFGMTPLTYRRKAK